MNIHWKDWCWSSNILATWCKESTHCKIPWCWGRLRPRAEGDDRGWDVWMASSTQWTWIWENSGREWRTGKPGVLQSMGLQRVRHELATEQQLPSAVITVLLDSYKGVLVLGNENSFQGLYSERIILILTVLKKKKYFFNYQNWTLNCLPFLRLNSISLSIYLFLVCHLKGDVLVTFIK